MARVSAHLSVAELEQRYVACGDATASRHFQAIWLLARGRTVSQVSATTAFGERWIEQLYQISVIKTDMPILLFRWT